MRFDVTPTVKVNEAEFGMSRAEVRGLMGQPKSEFRKFSDENTTDEYDSYHVFYDESGSARREEPPTPERIAEWRVVAQKAIDASLELADELEAA